MSEFYASSRFLGYNNFLLQYYSIVFSLRQSTYSINNAASRLKYFSGLGIETQVSELRLCSGNLSECKESVKAESSALADIIECIAAYEKKAESILGSDAAEIAMEEYKPSGEVVPDFDGNTEGGKGEKDYYTQFKEFFDTFVKAGSKIEDVIEKLLKTDHLKKLFGGVGDVFGDIFGTTFDVLSGIGNVMDIIGYYADGNVTARDIIGTVKSGFDLTVSSIKIAEVLTDVKLIADCKTAITETAMIGGKYVGSVTQYIPVANVILSTLFSGAESYEKANADGTVTTVEWCEVGIDASVDGLYACGEALICMACPPAAVGVAIFEAANLACKYFGGTSIKDMTKEGIKDLARNGDKYMNEFKSWVGDKCSDLGEWAGDTAEDVGNWAKDTAEDVGNWVSDRAEDFNSWAGGMWQGLCGVFS